MKGEAWALNNIEGDKVTAGTFVDDVRTDDDTLVVARYWLARGGGGGSAETMVLRFADLEEAQTFAKDVARFVRRWERKRVAS